MFVTCSGDCFVLLFDLKLCIFSVKGANVATLQTSLWRSLKYLFAITFLKIALQARTYSRFILKYIYVTARVSEVFNTWRACCNIKERMTYICISFSDQAINYDNGLTFQLFNILVLDRAIINIVRRSGRNPYLLL